MKLRIVTATRGESPYWDEMLASIRAAAGDADHVVVCPPAAVARLAARAGHARVVPEAGAGFYAALNQGWREPAGDWDAFTWLNDDDRLATPGFENLCRQLQDLRGVDIAYGRVELIDRRGRRVGEPPIARRPRDLPALLSRGIVPLAQPGTVIRRPWLEKLGGFDVAYRLAGDLDFFARALAAGAEFGYVEAAVAAFRLTAGQLSKSRAERQAETARALRPFGRGAGSAAALWRFRFDNLPAYLERLRRHGWASMEDVYARTT